MAIAVPIETPAGYACVFVGTHEEADEERAKEKLSAQSACAALAATLPANDPLKTVADAASKDPKLTAYELFGVVKEGALRAPKPTDATPFEPSVR